MSTVGDIAAFLVLLAAAYIGAASFWPGKPQTWWLPWR